LTPWKKEKRGGKGELLCVSVIFKSHIALSGEKKKRKVRKKREDIGARKETVFHYLTI